MQKFKGVIYQAINIQNGKSYIGKTVQDFEEYKNNHIKSALEKRDLKNNKKGKYFYKAIRKYSPNNFKWIILGEIENYNIFNLIENLNEAEKESIWLFRTFGSDGENYDEIYGYNLTKGGDGGDTLSNHPDKEIIFEKLLKSKKETLKNNPEISINQGRKLSETLKNNPEIIILTVKKILETKKNNPLNTEKGMIKANITRIENKIFWYKDNPGFIHLNYLQLILLYFNKISINKMLEEYNSSNKKISIVKLREFLKILNFPVNSIHWKKKREIYLKFVEENKGKIQWYIENYERLEEEYFERKWKEKYKNLIIKENK